MIDPLQHARNLDALSPREQAVARELIQSAIDFYRGDWPQWVESEIARKTRVLRGVNQAIAALIAHRASDSDFTSYADEQTALLWLESFKTSSAQEQKLGRERDWMVRSLWEIKRETEIELGELEHADDERGQLAYSSYPPAPSRSFDHPVQRLIFDLCQVWHDFVDRNLGLPRRDPEPGTTRASSNSRPGRSRRRIPTCS